MRGWGGGAVFLAMQVLEIPAGGRGFPLVIDNVIIIIIFIIRMVGTLVVIYIFMADLKLCQLE